MKSLILTISLLFAWSSMGATTLINGAGATFPYPLYSKWSAEYAKINPNIQINYQSIGSGGGIKQFTEKVVDFGASDAPMTDEQIEKAGGASNVLHIPTVLGAVVVTYQVPGVTELKLTSEIIAEIFLGKLTKWNDPKITKLNPGTKLQGDILVVHRSDGSGTTAIFTDYLSKVSSAWKSTVGSGTAVKWPAGIGGKGNEGVAGSIKNTPGSIGYVELIYAENNGLPYASVKNSSGNYIKPSLEGVTTAAAGALKNMPADYRVSITDAPGKKAYPISGFTYLLIHKKQTDAVKGKALVEFIQWGLGKGQGYATELHFAPLPKELVSKVEKTMKSVSVGETKVN